MTRRVRFLVDVRVGSETEAEIVTRLEATLRRIRRRLDAARLVDPPETTSLVDPMKTPSRAVRRSFLHHVDRLVAAFLSEGWDQTEAEELAVWEVADANARRRTQHPLEQGRVTDAEGKLRSIRDHLNRQIMNLVEKRRDVDPDTDAPKGAFDLDWADKNRINRRAARIHKARQKAAGLPASLKAEEKATLMARAGGVTLAGPGTAHAADELAAAILEEMPWIEDAVRHLWHGGREAADRGDGLVLAPMLLVGPPGVGKSHLARRVTDLAGVPFVSIDVGAGSEGFRVGGLTRGWGSAYPGAPVETILATGIGNPLVFVDEIDKGGAQHSLKGSLSTSAWTSLLGLLEPGTAARWVCPYYGVAMDMSRVTWILAANSLKGLPEPLLSRLRIVRVDRLRPQQLADVARREGLRRGLDAEAAEALAAVVQAQGTGLDLRAVLRLVQDLVYRERRDPLH